MLDERIGTRSRLLASRVLFASVAVGTIGFVASITVSPLVGEDLGRSAALSGLPWAAGVLGTGVGSMALSQLMARRGRGPGLILGYALGALGAGLAAYAVIAGSFVLFVPAIFLMGGGNSANHLSRYAAADLYPPQQRGSAVGMVVWAGTIGGVVGPALLDPSGRLAQRADLPSLAGPFGVALIGSGLAVVFIALFMSRSPGALRPHDDGVAAAGTSLVEMWRVPRAQVALIALAVGQTAMVLIMAMTPVHIRSTGHGLSSIGIVISAHVFGMYGLSPISGRLTDRYGPVSVILGGFSILAAGSLGAAAAPHAAGTWLVIPLFLLGFGWSLSFVAGSALLTQGLSYADRARLQGGTDFVVWTAAATAGLGSGVLVGTFGYPMLCIVGAALIAAPVGAIAGRRRLLVAQS